MELLGLNHHLKMNFGFNLAAPWSTGINWFVSVLSRFPGDDEFDDFPEPPGEWHVAIIVI